MSTSFPDFYLQQKSRVEEALDRWLPDEEEFPSLLNRSMRYSIFNGGKRLRGVLVLESGRLGEHCGEALEALSAVLEMIHAYSLVHDDLPAMDDDDFRRGQPSNHKKFGEDIAILAGDGLLTHVFGVVGELDHLGVRSDIVAVVLRLLDRYAGGKGMIGGQVLDLKASPTDGLEELQEIHRRKTAALITAALEIGARISEIRDSERESLRTFGQSLGLLFQIKDDLLEVDGTLESLGKDPDSDEEKEKLTYPSLLGVEESKTALKETRERALNALSSISAETDRLQEILDLVIERKH